MSFADESRARLTYIAWADVWTGCALASRGHLKLICVQAEGHIVSDKVALSGSKTIACNAFTCCDILLTLDAKILMSFSGPLIKTMHDLAAWQCAMLVSSGLEWALSARPEGCRNVLQKQRHLNFIKLRLVRP